ncbi:dihydrodipicolinate synthetase [Desulfurococcaceae archaeon AG1]|nr:dihydrodipicolinate synthetase [Desulfurococcaceae archaeon AG1]
MIGMNIQGQTADTHICGICNAVPEISDLMYKSIVMGDMEKAVKYKSLLMKIKGLAREFQVEGLSIVKAILRLRGLNVGNPVPPNKGLSDNEMRKLREILESILSDAGVNIEFKRIF